MNKQDLINQMALGSGISKTSAEKALDVMVRSVKCAVSKGDKVTISHFGTFTPKVRAPRVGRNIQTGAAVKIASRTLPSFDPSESFKNICKSLQD